MKIIGVGCCPGMLTECAIEIIRSAKKCYGSERAIHLVEAYLRPDCERCRVTDYQAIMRIDEEDAVVLSTGDPMLGGLGSLKGEVIPGISSLQLACARLKVPWLKVVTHSAHGRDYRESFQAIVDDINRQKVVFLLTDPEFDLPRLALFLRAHTITCEIAVCENLGYPNENIEVGSTASPPKVTSPLYCLVIGAIS